MQKFVTILAGLIITAFIAGCGGGSSTTSANTTTYAAPATPAPVPENPLMGGAVREGAIAAKFPNYSVSTLAGTAGAAGFTNYTTSTLPATAKFNRPMGITTNGTNLYATDYINNAIRKIDPISQKVTTLTDLKENGIAVTLNQPTDITTDGKNLYVVDSGNNVIRRIAISDNSVTTIGSTNGVAGAVDSTVPADVRFNQPIGITTDGVNLYVTDSGNHTIRWILIKGANISVKTLAGAPGSAGPTDGTLSAARFNIPAHITAHITTDKTQLYVTDFNNRTIREIDVKAGTVRTIAGKADTPPGTNDADADVGTNARFNQPNGITTDGTSLYVTDSFNNTIRKISLTGTNKVEKMAGITYFSGQDKSTGHVDSIDGTPSFWSPTGITTDGTALYVADSGNHTIRKIK